MNENVVIFSVSLIFCGAAILSTAALLTRQALLVAYIALGVLFGPYCLKLIPNIALAQEFGDIGIVFLLFLLGLSLNPKDLLNMLKKTFWIIVFSTLIFMVFGFLIAYVFGFSVINSLVIGTALSFSSTIIGLKLLPTTVLHHQHTGEIVISILLLQDLLAILVMLLIHLGSLNYIDFVHIGLSLGALPILFGAAFLFMRFILVPLFTKFGRVHEYIFLLAIGWCLSMTELANALGLSYEIGAFIAGITIASGPIALYISESLKPLRDFFLIVFFFSIGAGFNLSYLHKLFLPIILLSVALLATKPLIFRILLKKWGETSQVSWEVGFRLGQASCFSILVGHLAEESGLINNSAAQLIHAATILTFIVSSYIVVLFYPTPIAISDRLRRD
jgi:Kef-type K+ transport system membrane component KefB